MTEQKKIKKSGPIRTEAVIPFLLVFLVFWLYFHFLFDKNLRSLIEFGGYQLVGAEVNVGKLETSFFKASFRIQQIEITDAEKPTHNVLRIGDIRYGLLWDGLLRARFIVTEMAIEQIEFNTLRKKPGKVKPPEPPEKKSNEPSVVEKEANKLKNKAIEKSKEKYSTNILGDIAAMMSGSTASDQAIKIEDSLASKQKLKELNLAFKEKQTKWDEKFKTLPQGKDIQSFGDRVSRLKTKDFKSPQEFQETLQQADLIFKDADSKIKQVQSTNEDFNKDLKYFESGIKELDQLVKNDIQLLEARFKIPKIDAKSISQSVFAEYLNPYIAIFNKYKLLVVKYLPPNLLKKDNNPNDVEIKAHPRAKGISYEFGKVNSYPMFWIKRISISSQAGPTMESGNIKGLVTDLTSNQQLINRPTISTIEGNFPGFEIQGLLAKIVFDGTKELSLVDFDFSIQSYPINGRDLISTPDIKISFKKAQSNIKIRGSLKGLEDFNFSLKNNLQKIDYDVTAKDETINSIVNNVFKELPMLTVDASGVGQIPNNLNLSVESNLGPELQKGFEKQIQKKIDEAKKKLQLAIDEAIGKEKIKFEAEFNKAKVQIESEIKKITEQINTQKNQVQNKIDQAKKDSESQAKKSIEQEGKKAIDDLKKKLGF